MSWRTGTITELADMPCKTLYLTTEASRSITGKDLALYLTFAGPKGGNIASIMLTREQAIALHNGLVEAVLKMPVVQS